MAKVSFDGGDSFLDPLSPFNEFKIKRNISHHRVWDKLIHQMDPELRDQTLTMLQFPSPYLPLLQQRIEFLSAYLILSPDPLIITVTLYDLGILLAPQDGEVLPPPTDRDLYRYGLTREAWETGREAAKGPQTHPDSWYEERDLIPPARHTRAQEEQQRQFKWRNHYEKEMEEIGRKDDFESRGKSRGKSKDNPDTKSDTKDSPSTLSTPFIPSPPKRKPE